MRLLIAFLCGGLLMSFQQLQAIGAQQMAAAGLGSWAGYKMFKTLSDPSKRKVLSKLFSARLKVERKAAQKAFFKLIRRGVSVTAAIAVLCGRKIPSGLAQLFLMWLFGFKPGEIGLWWLAGAKDSDWSFEFEFGRKPSTPANAP